MNVLTFVLILVHTTFVATLTWQLWKHRGV